MHVPPFDVIPAEEQLAFACELLRQLRKQPAVACISSASSGSSSAGGLLQVARWLERQPLQAAGCAVLAWLMFKKQK